MRDQDRRVDLQLVRFGEVGQRLEVAGCGLDVLVAPTKTSVVGSAILRRLVASSSLLERTSLVAQLER
jgi:hypothetical protein